MCLLRLHLRIPPTFAYVSSDATVRYEGGHPEREEKKKTKEMKINNAYTATGIRHLHFIGTDTPRERLFIIFFLSRLSSLSVRLLATCLFGQEETEDADPSFRRPSPFFFYFCSRILLHPRRGKNYAALFHGNWANTCHGGIHTYADLPSLHIRWNPCQK